MKVVTRIADLDHPPEIVTGFVPTMGAFHEGHLELMRVARKECERVVVSIFVNPTQFGVGEDFERYPRNLERDAALAEKVGVDVLFAPSPDEIYPRVGTTVQVPMVSKLWEGASRPGHFDGVATVVCKLFNIVRPRIAYFGLKDLQQCLVISRMTDDLNLPIQISLQPTVRESDGLAMSSRNAYLSSKERAVAHYLYKRITECADAIKLQKSFPDQIEQILENSRYLLAQDGFTVDYCELIDLETTEAVRCISKRCAVVVAAKLGRTRLIDNFLL